MELQNLIAEREKIAKDLSTAEKRSKRCTISKQIQKLTRKELRKRKTNEILQKLESFSDIKSFSH